MLALSLCHLRRKCTKYETCAKTADINAQVYVFGKGLTSLLSCVLHFLAFCHFPNVSWSTSELRVRLAPGNLLKSSSKIFILTFQRRFFFYGSFVLFMSCVCHALASVHCCLVVTCWEKADLLALVCDD